jgi:hypothetical protein
MHIDLTPLIPAINGIIVALAGVLTFHGIAPWLRVGPRFAMMRSEDMVVLQWPILNSMFPLGCTFLVQRQSSKERWATALITGVST